MSSGTSCPPEAKRDFTLATLIFSSQVKTYTHRTSYPRAIRACKYKYNWLFAYISHLLMTIGVYITFRILDIADLTVEGSIAMGASIAAQVIASGGDPYLATLLSLLGGMLAGLATGILHTKLRIPALLSGILTMIALYSSFRIP